MKQFIHCPPENIQPDEKRRFLQRIQAFRIPIEKNEAKDTEQYMYFVRGQYKYSRTDPALIELVETLKAQGLAKKGRWEGPWDILEERGSEEQANLPQPLVLPGGQSAGMISFGVEVAVVEETEYRPSCEFATWNAKIQRVHRQFLRHTPFPVWLYNIRIVQRELGVGRMGTGR